MSIVVQKFGGSSVADAGRLDRVARRVARKAEAGHQVVVVVSAMGDSTDDLIALARQINPVLPQREMDMLLATGEQQSIALLAMALLSLDCRAVSLTGAQAGVCTDGFYSRAKITHIDCRRIIKELDAGNIVIVAGFQGVDEAGNINTLGRGGSDTSAVALAVALEAELCEIFTDVEGIYTADPRIVKKAWKIPEISYDEMLEMAAMGAQVLQPRSVEVAKQYKMPLHVRSSFKSSRGTMVKEVTKVPREMEKELLVCGIAHDLNILKTTIFDAEDNSRDLARIFVLLAAENINLDMISRSSNRNGKQDISFTTGRDDKQKVEKLLKNLIAEMGFGGFEIVDTLAKVSIVGAGMITNPGVAANMFQILLEQGIEIDMITTSEIKISCVIDETKVKDAVLALHTGFNLDVEDK